MNKIEDIIKIFAEAEDEDHVDTSLPMLYSFDFVDADPEKLESLGNTLDGKGFLFVDIFQLGDEKTEEPTGEYLLQVDKIDTHTPETLCALIEEINADAAAAGVAMVDGWDMSELDEEEEDESEDIEEI